MVAIVFVFTKNFTMVNDKYNDKIQELNSTFEKLAGTESQLNSTIENLEVSSLREEDLRSKYNQIKNERDLLKIDVDNKNKKILELDLKAIKLQKEIDLLNKDINELQDENSCLRSGSGGC
jgi:chromosome segregation ATPase